ncbi:uncharacterized protein PV09_07250 [Verruconis gallopava]|uniref:TAFII28-like protein domain-containing protein n=1 Tax=Verruconis gallopava TaxID=253628 RepID=A0A0D1YK06_9PEZI|nr:uncharacterized protein PV09_07250 [Verruconis gallopava]KIW01202.1 hypothetical protein PV09_07250 [Verruconis gallopava]
MATSPPFAGSPPGTGTPISRKRPSLPAQMSSSKRRKPSTAGPSHLRQTSFPPEELPRDARSPSADSAAVGTSSVISGVGGKRGRRGKSGSVIGTGSRVNGTSRAVSASAVDGIGPEDEVDDEDDDGDVQDNLQGDEADAEEREKEAEALRILTASFDPARAHVYANFLHVGRTILPRIRKLANHTLSQSVPSSVVLTISSYTKVFLGELIDTARRVQTEWQAADDKFPDGTPIPNDATLKERTKPEWRGPLTPDHLREALRRIKKDRVGGAGGFMGVSLSGKERTAAKMGGRRLFR